MRVIFYFLIALIVSCNQDQLNNTDTKNLNKNEIIKTGNIEIVVPKLTVNDLNSLGLIRVNTPSEWESFSLQHKPLYQVITLNKKTDIYVNFHAALVLHYNKKNLLPSISESHRFIEHLNGKPSSFLSFANENTSFVQYQGKIFDLKVANYWILSDSIQLPCSLHVLTISPEEDRAYITKSSCQSAYPLRNIEIGR
ncbi:MAG: hypothetical protein ACKO2O_08090 [Crocinitomicaceae bacterium]